jgi:hypothetical protein
MGTTEERQRSKTAQINPFQGIFGQVLDTRAKPGKTEYEMPIARRPSTMNCPACHGIRTPPLILRGSPVQQLDDWIIANGLTRDEVGRRLHRSRERVDALCDERIFRRTDGQVDADDLILGSVEDRQRLLRNN